MRTMINGRWPLKLPEHRANRPEWPYWEAARLAAMHHTIRPGDVVWDVGAEAGDFPALFTTWGAQVVMVEPNPKAWPTIKATFDMNGLDAPPWAVVLLSDKCEGTAEYDTGSGSWPDCAEGPVDVAHGFAHIGEGDHPTTRLDWMVLSGGFPVPDVITMDVEGGEGHVIRGAKRTLEACLPTVFVSIHPQFMADLYGETPDEIHDTLRDLGYHARFLAEDHEQHWVFAHPDRRPFPGAGAEYYRPGQRIVL